MPRTVNNLQSLAKDVERRLNAAKGPNAIANLICRLMLSKDPNVAKYMTAKWVEWRHGKVPEPTNITVNNQPIMVIAGYTNDRIKRLRSAQRDNDIVLDISNETRKLTQSSEPESETK